MDRKVFPWTKIVSLVEMCLQQQIIFFVIFQLARLDCDTLSGCYVLPTSQTVTEPPPPQEIGGGGFFSPLLFVSHIFVPGLIPQFPSNHVELPYVHCLGICQVNLGKCDILGQSLN